MDKLQILELIEKGEITPDEGARLITEVTSSDQEKPSEKMIENDMQILEKIESGDLSIEDGINKLHEKNGSTKKIEKVIKINDSKPNSSPLSDHEMQKWRNWWTIPVFVGFAIVILSGIWMNSAYSNSGVGFWYIFSWIPLLSGIAIMGFSWPSPNRTWLHVRVKQAKGQKPSKIAISIPMPLRLISWGLKIAKRFVSDDTLDKLDEIAIEDMIMGIGKSAADGTPFYVEVDEGDGDKVEVYFG